MEEKKVWIYDEIETKRIELRNIVNQSTTDLHREDIVRISQELDVLITKYYAITSLVQKKQVS